MISLHGKSATRGGSTFVNDDDNDCVLLQQSQSMHCCATTVNIYDPLTGQSLGTQNRRLHGTNLLAYELNERDRRACVLLGRDKSQWVPT